MFHHLRTKLSVLYAGLFAAILLVICCIALAAVSANARGMVRRELAASGLAYERGWAQRAAEFQNDGELLSRDFGFRTAVATHDEPTIRSALQNLKVRLGIDSAMLIQPDGSIIAADAATPTLSPAATQALQGDDTVSGVLLIGDGPYEAVSVPFGGGGAAGWLVFAAKLDQRPMKALEGVAAIPLTASAAFRGPDGCWRDPILFSGPARAALAGFLDHAQGGAATTPTTLQTPGGAVMALAKPLDALIPGQPVVLLLQYPLALAMAPYRLLMGLLAATGLLGLCVVIAGARILSGTVTRPITALDQAAHRLQRGERVQVEVRTRDEIGRLAKSFNAMAADIKQRQSELEAARDHAEAANRAKSAFLANMSHEVRTPLNGVIGVAGVLAKATLTDEQQRMVGVIQNSASLLQRVLDDVLDLARVEAGRMDVIAEDFDLAAAVGQWSEAARIQCEAKGLAFDFALDDDARAVVRGDRIRLEQVLGNLISNAVKFTPRGGVAMCVRRLADGGFRFEVADTGIGFDPADAELLFQPFQQADGTLTRKYGGAGLGLSLSRKLARAMGGELDGTGKPGAGATFTLDLPLPVVGEAPTAHEDAPAADAGEIAEAGETLRILVVDDNEANRMVAKLILEGVGAEVVCAEDGEQGVAAFAGGGFHLIFMDMQMPVMDGLAAIRAIRAMEQNQALPRLPILMLSANAMPEHVEAAHAAGADGHVAKPITPERLIAAVQGALWPDQADAGADSAAA